MLPNTSIKDSAVTEGTRESVKSRSPGLLVCRLSNPVGEPDAANPHVRFDEREVETEQGRASEAPANERAGHR